MQTSRCAVKAWKVINHHGLNSPVTNLSLAKGKLTKKPFTHDEGANKVETANNINGAAFSTAVLTSLEEVKRHILNKKYLSHEAFDPHPAKQQVKNEASPTSNEISGKQSELGPPPIFSDWSEKEQEIEEQACGFSWDSEAEDDQFWGYTWDNDPQIKRSNFVESNYVDSAYRIEKDAENSRLLKQFKLLNELGRGSFGCVWKAYDTIDQQEYAVKIIPMFTGVSEEVLHEPRLHALLSPHPNICRYMGVWKESFTPTLRQTVWKGNFMTQSDDDSYLDTSLSQPNSEIPKEVLIIQMELFEMNLKEYLKKRKAVDPIVSLRIFHDVLAGVGQLHRKEYTLLHRDIKPANVFLKISMEDEFQKASIGDFGLATELQYGIGGVGTVTYAAPEQKNGLRPYNEKADIYPLGLILFELFNGPWTTECERRMELNNVQHTGSSNSFRLRWQNIANLVDRALSKVPEDRPAVEEIYDVICDELARRDVEKEDDKRDRLSLLREIKLLKKLLAESGVQKAPLEK